MNSNWHYSGQSHAPNYAPPPSPSPMTPQQYQPGPPGAQPLQNLYIPPAEQVQPYQLPQYQPTPTPKHEKGKGGGFLKALNVFSGKSSSAATSNTPAPTNIYPTSPITSSTMYHAPTSLSGSHAFGPIPGSVQSSTPITAASQPGQSFISYQTLQQQSSPQPPQTTDFPQWGKHNKSRPPAPQSSLPQPPALLPTSLQIQQQVQQQQIYLPGPAQKLGISPVPPPSVPYQQQQQPPIQQLAQPCHIPGSYVHSQNAQPMAIQSSEAPPPPYSNPTRNTPQRPGNYSSQRNHLTEDEETILQPSRWPNEKAVPLSAPKPNPIPKAINNLNRVTRSDSIASEEETKVPEKIELFSGNLFDESKNPPEPKPLLSEFLRAIGKYLISTWEKTQNMLISPDSMAILYSTLAERGSTKLDFFASAQQSPKPIVALYKHLDCQYFFIPRRLPRSRNGTTSPTMSLKNKELQPGLTLQGFERWMVIQILNFPDREWKRIDKLLKLDNVKLFRDDGVSIFPTQVPRSAFPDAPNPEMVSKYGQLFSPLKVDSSALLQVIENDAELNDKGKDGIIEELRKTNDNLKNQIFEKDQEIKRLRQQFASIRRPESVAPNTPAPTLHRQSIAFPDPVIPGIGTPAATPIPSSLRSTPNPINRQPIQAPISTIPECEMPSLPSQPSPRIPIQPRYQTPQHNQNQETQQQFRPKPVTRASSSYSLGTITTSSPSSSPSPFTNSKPDNYRPYIAPHSLSSMEKFQRPKSWEKRESEHKAMRSFSWTSSAPTNGGSSIISADRSSPPHEKNREDALKRASMMLVDPSVRQRIEKEKEKEIYITGNDAFKRQDEFAKITGGL